MKTAVYYQTMWLSYVCGPYMNDYWHPFPLLWRLILALFVEVLAVTLGALCLMEIAVFVARRCRRVAHPGRGAES